jgi:hypothetical protein
MEVVSADKLYEFLTEISAEARSLSHDEIARWVDDAMRYCVVQLPSGEFLHLPITSEFLGEAMTALRKVLSSTARFSPERTSLAKEYVDAIQQQWFSAPLNK